MSERLAATQLDLQRLNGDATRLAELTWEAELAEETYREHARSLEEARVNSALDDLQMSDVSVIQDATLNLKKSGPMRGLLAVVGLLLGLSLGLLQAILRDSPVSSTGGSRGEISRNKAAKSRRRTKSADVATNTDSDLDDVMHEQEDIRSNETVTAGVPTGDTVAMNETSATFNAPMPR